MARRESPCVVVPDKSAATSESASTSASARGTPAADAMSAASFFSSSGLCRSIRRKNVNHQDTKGTKRFFQASNRTRVLALRDVELKTTAWCPSCLGGSTSSLCATVELRHDELAMPERFGRGEAAVG